MRRPSDRNRRRVEHEKDRYARNDFDAREKVSDFARSRACIIQAGKKCVVRTGRERRGQAAVLPSSINHFSPACKTMQRRGADEEHTPLFTRVKSHEYARVRQVFIFIHPRLLYIHSRVNSNLTTLPNGIIAC